MLAARDLWYAARGLRRSPGFAAVALAALALGIGAATAIFSVVDAVLLKPIPFLDADRLVVVWELNPAVSSETGYAAPWNLRAWQEQSRTLAGFAAIHDSHVSLIGGAGGEPEELRAERISASLFPVLGVKPVAGRPFRYDEDQPGHSNFALLSHRLWMRRFGGSQAAMGQTVRVDGAPYTVLGVMPPGFSELDSGVDVWLPLALDPNDARAANLRYLEVIARLAPGVGVEQARREMDALAPRLAAANPTLDQGWKPALVPVREEVAGHAERALLTLAAAVGFLLLMACANVANLLLARGAVRRKEIAVRVAMGAGRGRIAAQLLAESLLLGLAGGAVGAVLARFGIGLFARFGPANIPALARASLDARALLFSGVASVACGALFGLAPAMGTLDLNLNDALMEGGRGGSAGRAGRGLRNALVVLEVALAVVVLVGGGLLMRSFLRLRATDPGFEPRGLLTFRLPMAGGRNAATGRRAAFLQQVEENIGRMPGVRGVGAVNSLPVESMGVGTTFAIAGQPAPPPDRRPEALMRTATPSYFRAMGIPLEAGRAFAASDAAGAPPVVIVNRTLARTFWGSANPLGGRITVDNLGGRVAEVVGVVGDVKPEGLRGSDWPTIYNPYPQAPAPTMTVVVRGRGGATPPMEGLARAVHEIDPNQQLAEARPMEDILAAVVAEPLFDAALLDVFAGIAFLLAAVGIYGVISYDVSRRTKEIGIRAALGARPGTLLAMVLAQGARLAGCGIALGLGAALALTRLMAGLLYEVAPADPWTFAAVPLALGAVALLASYIPARRAMALDPMTALRTE
ncbi:MAG TPA: ABC transporter permease [Bryobacteraceae bacterium]|nr:ABC transporter permease [Bryobacteraceae bacterium]